MRSHISKMVKSAISENKRKIDLEKAQNKIEEIINQFKLDKVKTSL